MNPIETVERNKSTAARSSPPAEPMLAEVEHAPPHAQSSPPPPPSPATAQPPKGPRLWKVLLALVVLGVIFWIGAVWGDNMLAGVGGLWDRITGEPAAEHAHDDDQFWTCGMHPWVILPDPGLCPICHMDLTPLDPAKLTGEIAIDPVVVQNIGVRITPVTSGPLVREIRTVGSVTYDESTVRTVNTKIAGWIEELYVDQEGGVIEVGQPLFDLYSPELYAAQDDYLQAWRNRDQISAEFLPEAARGAQTLLEATRTRLKFFDVSDEQIKRLQESGEVRKTITVASPHTGVVVEKHVQEGARVEPGMLIYRIADLSKVWVMATLYEYQLPYVEVGQPAVMTLPYLPGETFEGRVAYIYPYLNAEARQIKVRLEFDNRDGRLKPGMFANVELQSRMGEEAILMPRDAVIATGERKVAFVSLGNGRFEPRDVEVGAETTAGMVQVLGGVKPGEQVVISGQFLLDSESRMRSALAKMVKGDLASEQEPLIPVAGTPELQTLPPSVSERLTSLLNAYFEVGRTLAADRLDGVAPAARQIAEAAEALPKGQIPEQPEFWSEHRGEVAAIIEQARALAAAKELQSARHSYAVLSDALDRLLVATGVPPMFDGPVYRFVCGWLKDAPREGMWLQTGTEPRNPLMGAESGMLACNIPARQRQIPVTGQKTFPSASEPEAGAASPALSEAEVAEATVTAPLPDELAKALNAALRSYIEIGDLLASDKVSGVALGAQQLAAQIDQLPEHPIPGNPHFWHESTAFAAARGKALELAETKNLSTARLQYAALSKAMYGIYESTGVPLSFGERIVAMTCPMFPPKQNDAVWLQPASEPRNPYMGQKMLGCVGEQTLLLVAGAAGADSNTAGKSGK